MSEKKETNERIIEELTKGLESSRVSDDSQSSGDYALDDEEKGGKGDGKSVNNQSKTSSNEEFFDVASDEFDKHEPDTQKDDDSDTDSIDELGLKDLEITLDEDQKAEKRLCAEELKKIGNNIFKDGNYERAIEKYTDALKICPVSFSIDRAILYSNRAAAKMKMGDHEKAIKDCTKSVEYDEKYVKAYLRRAQCYELKEKLDECLADYKKILELDPAHSEAQKALIRLPPLIEERNEKMKAEMLTKLKDLGNMILKPFGLSTNNFQLNQDPETKGYSVNFKQ